MSNTLWTTPYQSSGKIIKAVAALGGVPIENPTAYEHYVDNKKPEFLSKFPHGKIPAFEEADGFKLFEGTAIARYVAGLAPNAGLLGKDRKEAALIDQWMHLMESEVDVYTSLSYQIVNGGITPYNKPLDRRPNVENRVQIHNTFLERQKRALKTLNDHLASRTFFVGERITLADVYIASQLRRAATVTFDAASRAEFSHLIRHLETIVNQPQLKDIFEPVEFIEKPLQYVPPAKEKKEPKPAAAPAPKAEKKPKATENDDDDEELDVPAAPKVKNPLDDLPKSTFNLEDWKRQYSNNDTRGAGGSLEWFYKNFDAAGFSVWRFDFKYNEELTLTFMSANQITGFYNRLEASRKYLFASAGVLGESNNSVISGALILRGLEAQPVVDVAPDWESYAYKKLDLSNTEDKAFFEAALAWDLEIDGKKWVDGKLARATAAYAGVPVELPAVYQHFVDNKKPEFLAKFPHGKIPALERSNGFKLFESVAIARYLAGLAPNSGLLGSSLEDSALVDQWIHLTDSEIHNHFTERQTRALKTLDVHLASRTFFVGERITLADIFVAGVVQRAVAITVDAATRAELPHLIRHLETIVNQPLLRDSFGPIEYIEKAVQYVPPPKEKKEAKPAPAAVPKAEKKPKAIENDEEEEPDVPAAPKVKNPLDDLPKSTFNLEDWKRQYSNNDTRGAGGSLEWFYKNFDASGFSIWRFDFKYNEELTLTFMSANQITGFYNRLEASRKYLFASAGVLGEPNNSIITGTLILRGLEAQPVVDVAPDWESYTYKKLDLLNEKDKAFFEAALAWDLEIDGKKWVDGKLFK
ncbi:hypothetical protein DXG01_011312 [Tephrocybe rancida]|nr:hypothetical protein DXG01_011312 [Tephrocybe rancida]